MIELRVENDDHLIGLTIVSWWKRFGHRALSDSISEVQKQIAPIAAKLAA